MLVREETPADFDAIREINRLAFGGEAEGQLIDRLRADGDVVLSLVAQIDGEVVGHILFSKLQSQTKGRAIKAVALAPMAVTPEFQERGIGTALIERGHALLRERGYTVVVVLGHPDYYPRFGFTSAKGQALKSPYSELGEAYMALELVPGALEGVTGTITYADAFAALA
jgi:putative acetyltransferase